MYTSPSSKRILITGATGFIGGHLVNEAKALGLEVWIAIRPSSNRKRAEALGVKVVELDYVDEAGMHHVLQSTREVMGTERPWHYIIHNAGLTKAVHASEYYEANAEHTRRLCSALLNSGCSPERFVLVSSLSSYSGRSTSDGIIRITDKQIPTTDYGRSKLLAERYVRESGLPYSMILPTGVYGPGEQDYLMALQSIQGGINFMAGLKPQRLTFVYGADVARAALLVAQHPEALGQSYIVADGDVHSDSAFGQMASELLNAKRTLNLRMPLPLLRLVCWSGSLWARLSGRAVTLNSDKYQLMAERSWACDTAPLRALGWMPTKDLREGLRETIRVARAEGLLK